MPTWGVKIRHLPDFPAFCPEKVPFDRRIRVENSSIGPEGMFANAAEFEPPVDKSVLHFLHLPRTTAASLQPPASP